MNYADIIQQKDQQIAALSAQVEALQQQLDWFKRQIFGRKSEKQLVDNAIPGDLFADLDLPASTDEEAAPTTEIKAHQRRKKQHQDSDINDTGLRFDDRVPRQVIDVSVPELEGDEADNYEIIDYKETCRLAQRPGAYVVLVYRRPVVRHKASQTLSTPAAPSNVLDGTYTDVSLLAGILCDKFLYHLPLYRQHQRLQDAGVTLSRTCLTNWSQRTIELLTPIYLAMQRSILQSKVLAMDETPIKAGRKQKGKMQQSWFWPIFGDNHEILFTWSSSRGRQHVLEQLADFEGTLLTDGYAAYSRATHMLNAQEQKVIHANCWVHCRRAFEKALKMEPEAAQHALNVIAKLCHIENHMRDHQYDDEKIQSYRLKNSEPLVEQFFAWVYEQRQRLELLPSNPLAKALVYADERQAELKVFLANPGVAMDTNHLERALRPIPMGRKNYLFCWTELGAKHVGIIQSLLVTCRLQGINPYHYLVDVLQRINLHPADKVEELTPRLWKEKFADNFLTSDLA